MSGCRDAVRFLAGARESAFAKVEQEASLQRHRARLVGAGLLDDAGEAWLRPRREQTLDESERTFEVLSEVLAAQTRVDAPGAAAAAERRWRRHRAGAPPPLSEEDVEILRRARASAAAAGALSIGGYGASALVLPKLSLRPRGGDFGGGGGGMAAAAPPPVPPAVAEAAARGLAAGARAGAYGSALALAGAALGSLFLARSMMGSSSGDEGDSGAAAAAAAASLALKEAMLPLGDAARGALEPVASWARREIGGGEEGGGEGGKGKKSDAAATAEFSASLGRRLDASRRKWASRAGIGSSDEV